MNLIILQFILQKPASILCAGDTRLVFEGQIQVILIEITRTYISQLQITHTTEIVYLCATKKRKTFWRSFCV